MPAAARGKTPASSSPTDDAFRARAARGRTAAGRRAPTGRNSCRALPAIPALAHNLANIVKSIFGKNKKALVLDLDHTLWGGVVGDDGVEGLEIGQETSMGQVYREFQSYVKEHKNLGIMLNVSSKNEEENAIAGLNHPDGILRPSDFILIKANWEPKCDNIKMIAQILTSHRRTFGVPSRKAITPR